ncbi:hypothetical protein HYU93_02745 [Candidatus Daviesbacteria bacterium]|nr:hypothetical protein [Candidatus Daviesbacteria bacterium]
MFYQNKTGQDKYGFLAFRKVRPKFNNPGKTGISSSAYFNFSKIPRIITALLLIFSLILQNLIFNISPVYAASSPWSQTDWSGGSGQTAWSDATKFDSSSSTTTSTTGQVTITNTEQFSNTGFESDLTGWTASANSLGTNLNAFWKLDEASGTRSDPVGSNNLTDNNTVTQTTGKIGNAGQFTAANSEYLSVADNANLRTGDIDFTISGWFYKDSSPTTILRAVGKYNTTGNLREYMIDWSGSSVNRFRFIVSSDGITPVSVTANSLGAPSNSTWYFIVAWHDAAANTINIQVNNGTVDSAAHTTGIFTGAAPFTVGATGVPGEYWDGRIDAVGLWKRVLSSSERTVLYNSGNGVEYPFYTNTRDTTTTYSSSSGSSKVVTVDTTNFTQSVNVGDTNTYNLSAYAYTDGSAVTSSDAELFYNGSTITTTYTSVGSGWYQLTGTVTGTSSSVGYGVQVKAGKTVYLDNMSLNNYAASGTLTSSIFDTEFTSGAAWGTLTYTSSGSTAAVKVRTSNDSGMSGATAFSSCSAVTSETDISSNSCVTDSHRYIQYQLSLSTSDLTTSPTFSDISTTFAVYDADAPSISLTALTPDPNSDTTPTLSGTATESIGTVSNVQFQMDSTSDSWTVCTAGDGSFDETTEAFTCTPSALSDGSHTMYVRATDSNSNTTSNANASTDTFTIDITAPSSFDLDSPGNDSYTTNERPTFKWKAATDVTSGLSSYSLEVDNGNSGDFSITGIPTSGTADVASNRYVIHYDNSSDSDSTNDYISIYTKSSSSWGTGENDGKLKEGSRSWKVKAIDAAGNVRSQSRVVIVDLTSPILSSLSVSDSLGEKNSYQITTSQSPSITGTITDTYYPDKVVVAVYKENYFLGILTSAELVTARTQSLSNTSSTSLSFSAPVFQALDYGSYYVDITGTDKAGNTSGISTIYFKVMTSGQAQELLQGKISKEEKKTIQETAQVSLPELEKKAILRREKEAAEFDKLVQQAQDQFAFLGRIGGSSLAFIIDNTKTFFINSANLAGQTAHNLSYALNNLASAIADTTSYLIKGTGDSISKQTEVASSAINNTLQVITGGLGQTYNNLVQGAPGLVKNTMLALENGVNTVSSTISNTNQAALNTLNSSQTNLEDKISKSSKETSNLISGVGNGTISFISSTAKSTTDFLAFINTTLNNSQKEAGKQIAQTHKNTSDTIKDKSQKISKGISLAFRSFQKPVDDTADFLNRTKVWFLTFESVVIDANPTTISDVTIDELGKDYAVVSWKTNHYAWGKVNYGKDLTYGQEVLLTEREKTHAARLTGLKPGEKYYFEVMSQNKNYAYDAYYSFETKK